MARDDVLGAVRAAADRAAGKPVETQIDLLPPTRFDPKRHPVEHGRMAEAVRRDRAGRPAGAQNKTTRDMLDFIRKVLGDPMLESARQAMHTPETLAAELGCSKLEAYDRIQRVRSELLPYFYAKQAPVDADGKPVPGLTVEFHGHGAAKVAADGQPLPPWAYLEADAQSEQNQRLIDVTPSVSDGAPVRRSDK